MCNLASFIAGLGEVAVQLRYHRLHEALEEAGRFAFMEVVPAERLQADMRLLRGARDALTGPDPVMPEVVRRLDRWLGM